MKTKLTYVDACDVFDTRDRFDKFFCRIETADLRYLTLMYLENLEGRMEDAGVECPPEMQARIEDLLDQNDDLYVDVGDWN